MSSTNDQIHRLQSEQHEHNLRTAKIDKLKSAYAKYELGQLSNDEFKSHILNDIGLKDVGNLSKILSSTSLDKHTFQHILNSTDLVKHKQPEEKRNPYYTNKNNKFKRNQPPPQSYASKYEQNAHLKQSTTNFLKGTITPDEYRQHLQQQGINDKLEHINKLIRSKEEGNQILFADMINTINTHKKDSSYQTLIDSSINKVKGKDCRFKEDNGKENMEKLMMTNKGDKHFLVYGSKRKIDSDVNAFKSQKDVFDWDLNAMEMYKKELTKPKQQTYLKQMTKKNLYSSELFKEDKGNNRNDSGNCNRKKRYYAQSDIFNVKTEGNDNKQQSKGNSIRRVNKNAESLFTDGNVMESKGVKGRVATQLQVSKDNPFYC